VQFLYDDQSCIPQLSWDIVTIFTTLCKRMKYPVHFEIPYQDQQSRLSVLLRAFLALPPVIIFYILAFPTSLTSFLIGLSIVFLGEYPRWLFDLIRSSYRFNVRLFAYLLLLTDEYPTFHRDGKVIVDVDYPGDEANLSRILPLLKWLFIFPHRVVFTFLFPLMWFITPFCWLGMIFSGRYPREIFDFSSGILRWWLRVHAYSLMLTTDQYPPFSIRA